MFTRSDNLEGRVSAVEQRLGAFKGRVEANELSAACRIAINTLRGFGSVLASCDMQHSDPLTSLSPSFDTQKADSDTAVTLRGSDPHLAQIAAARAREDTFNAFTNVLDETEVAHVLRQAPNTRNHGTLAGIPIAVKDNMNVRGWPTAAGSRATVQNEASADSAVVAQLRSAGAIVIGQTNMDELAWGGRTDNPVHGPTLNPRNPLHGVGGSSGGAAAAVAAGIVNAAIGTDTGGSGRLPAAAVGVYGFRPSTGSTDTSGITPLAPSFDTVSPIAHSLGMLRTVAQVVTGRQWTRRRCSKLSLGILPALTGMGTDKVVGPVFDENISRLKTAGVSVQEMSLHGCSEFFHVWFLIHLIEPATIHKKLVENNLGDLGTEARIPLLAGDALGDTLLDEAQALRAGFNRRADALFEQVDAIISPTSAFVAPALGTNEVHLDGRDVPLLTASPVATWLASMAGLPALSLPIVTSDMPVGLQIIGRRGDDERIFDYADLISAQLDL